MWIREIFCPRARHRVPTSTPLHFEVDWVNRTVSLPSQPDRQDIPRCTDKVRKRGLPLRPKVN